jgi:uncharacterized protein
MKPKSIKVIIDTNVWISFLIGKKLLFLGDRISSGRITLVYCDELLLEIKEVTKRPKLKKYFPIESVNEMIDLIENIGVNSKIIFSNTICRDPKDNFLLDLIDASTADILVTGDKDLLALNPFKKTKIVSPSDFENEV